MTSPTSPLIETEVFNLSDESEPLSEHTRFADIAMNVESEEDIVNDPIGAALGSSFREYEYLPIEGYDPALIPEVIEEPLPIQSSSIFSRGVDSNSIMYNDIKKQLLDLQKDIKDMIREKKVPSDIDIKYFRSRVEEIRNYQIRQKLEASFGIYYDNIYKGIITLTSLYNKNQIIQEKIYVLLGKVTVLKNTIRQAIESNEVTPIMFDDFMKSYEEIENEISREDINDHELQTEMESIMSLFERVPNQVPVQLPITTEAIVFGPQQREDIPVEEFGMFLYL